MGPQSAVLPGDGELPGPDCYCGKAGCIETFLSGPGMTRDHRELTGENVEPPDIVRRALEGDAASERTLQRYEDRMARSLAHVINILDPDVIVLGEVCRISGGFNENVPRLWTKYVFSDRVDTMLTAPEYGDSSGVRGAALLWGLGKNRPMTDSGERKADLPVYSDTVIVLNRFTGFFPLL